MRAIVAEDDPIAARLVVEHLKRNGLEVEHVRRGDEVADAVARFDPRLVVLDVMMPGMNGLDVCRVLRARDPDLMVVMLTSLDSDVDEIVGLEVGADDYLKKPVNPRVLIARVRALLRRAEPAPEVSTEAPQQVGPLRLEPASRGASIAGREVALSDAEFELLALLVRHAGTIVDRDTLYQELRGIPYDGVDRAMDLRVSRLRARLGDEGRSVIRAVRGRGYMIARN